MCELCDDGLGALLPAFAGLEALHLAMNDIGDAGAARLTEMLATTELSGGY